jgi:hypothetical protein
MRKRRKSLDEVKFHWDVWKGESKAFWGRATLASVVLVISIFFQWDAVRIDMAWLKVDRKPTLLLAYVHAASWLLLVFLAFKFVDLFRHRPPEDVIAIVHTDRAPSPIPWGTQELDLLRIGRYLYLVFPLYLLMMSTALLATGAHLLGWI